MRLSIARLAAVTLAAIVTCAGCQLSGDEPTGPACSGQTFDLKDRSAAPLGPPKELVSAFNDAVDQQLESVTMAEMVNRAGWSGDWDRAIYFGAGMTDADLKQMSGSNLELACFTGRPQYNDDNPDMASPYMSLFLFNGQPIQAELWTGQNPSLDFGSREFLTPDTVFRFDPNPGVMVAE
ncbi:hypothetical protein AB0H71_23460 [Nocardia sp. NPDC050697]|uniref:hypothetical protein n=1 Tax=Nocardia sp. NPDC050697 TaxID=3155158 RepID=UPI0033D91799